VRYVKLRTIITKTSDQQVEDVADIKAILSVLTDKELDCCLQLTEGPKMELARILELDDEYFRFRAITKTASLIRRVRYDEIKLLEVHNFDSDIVVRKPRVSRWMLLEPVTILEDE
jgi:hypothetical protein